MRTTLLFAVLIVTSALGAFAAIQQPDDGGKGLNALLGKWYVEGTQNNGLKSSSNQDCRWSPQGSFMVCEQITKMAAGESRTLTVYCYDSKSGNYSYTAVSGSGAKPTYGALEIRGTVWTFDGSVENAGKTIQFRTVRKFIDAKTSNVQIMRSDDGGKQWQTILEAKMQKVGD
jgi:Protein of unknown function (DUF1579)